MKQINIVNNKLNNLTINQGKYSNKGEEAEVLAWFNACNAKNKFGLQARTVSKESILEDAYDLSVATNERTVDDIVVVDLPAEYTYEIIDITTAHNRAQVKQIVANAMQFGNNLMTDFATDNVLAGITQANKTKSVANYCASLQSLLVSGSLYAAKDEIDALISNGLPQNLEPFITEAKLLEYKQKIVDYLA